MPYFPNDPTMKKRSRDRHLGDAISELDNYTVDAKGKPVIVEGKVITTPVYGKQVTASEGHLWKNQFQGDDVGGPFETTSRYLALDKWGENPIDLKGLPKYNLRCSITGGWNGYRFNGHQFPTSLGATAWPQPEPSSDYLLTVLGASAIARVKPTNSVADLSVSLAELYREGLPLLPGRSQWKERAQIARGSGSEYLNTQFGWLPLIGEIQNLATVADKGDKLWRQYERDAGRLVRRHYEFDDLIHPPTQVSAASARYAHPTLISYFYPAGWKGADYVRTRHKRQKRWFKGAFTYYIPNKDSSSAVERFQYAATKARKLYGLSLDPEVLWNLAPWSWAADWFVNTGDILSNLSDMSTDGLVMPYGYMMEETIVSDEHTLTNLKWNSSPPGPYSLTIYCVTKTKKRIRASPYGFGLTFEDFTPRQIAILVALGITR